MPERQGGAGFLVADSGAGEQTARNLGLGGGRLGLVDETPRALGFDLVELVAIDGERAGLGRLPLARRTADAVFSPLIRVQDRGIMLIPMLQYRRTRPIAWSVLKDHWDADVANTDIAPLLKQSLVNAVSQLAQRGLAEEASAFLEQKRTPDIAETVAQGLERLRVNTAAAERLADELENELKVSA